MAAFFGGGDDTTDKTNDDATENNVAEQENAATTEEEKADEETTEEEKPAENKKQRDNSSAALTTLNAGTFVVGPDVPPGRYVITGEGSGNLFVYDESGMPVVNEILDASGEFGVPSVTTDLEENHEIEISGINSVTFTPATTELKTNLTTGTWVVGIDIPHGRYDVTSDGGSGNFFVYSKLGFPEVNEILDPTGEFGVEKVSTNLKDGQTVTISGISSVTFSPK